MTRELPASQFYTGLVADLYDPLVSERASAEDYRPFLDRAGTPALELGCGSGVPLLDLRALGYQVEGLDSSADMLARCRQRAAERGLEVTLHQSEMQSFSLPRRYRAVFLAGATFTLLTTDEDARRTLACIHRHLLPGGAALIPLEIVDPSMVEAALGHYREATSETGERLRCAVIEVASRSDGCGLRRRLRYERIAPDGRVEVLERDWLTRWWSQGQFRNMLLEAGFESVSFRAPEGGPAPADAAVFVALARRGA